MKEILPSHSALSPCQGKLQKGMPKKIHLNQNQNSFTLAEVLVVVMIIGVLAALLLPMLSRAIETVKATKCASNLKQIGAAFQTYAADNNGQLPPINMAATTANSQWYVNLLTPYIPVSNWHYTGAQAYGDTMDGVWRCPSATKFSFGGGYGVNETHLMQAGIDKAVRLARISRPTQLWLIGDACDASTAKKATWTAVYCPRDVAWGNTYEAAARHNNNANVCFVDGHVEPRSYNDLKTNKDDIFGHSGF